MDRLKIDCEGVDAGEKMLVLVFCANTRGAPAAASTTAALSMRRGQIVKHCLAHAPGRAIPSA
jgi:hypothetical protein